MEVLSAVAYVASRKVPGHTDKLQEVFTARRSGPYADMIQDACLDAMLVTTDDLARTARFLAYVGSQENPAPGRERCIAGLRELQPEATEEMLAYLGRSTDGAHRRRLAALIQRVTRIDSPKPLRFWETTTQRDEIRAAVEAWRSAVAEAN